MIIQRISRYISNFENLMPLFAAACAVLAAIAILSLPFVYAEDQLYPKHIDKESPLDPYDRGGSPFTRADIVVQYPENSPTAGYVTAYLTPFSWALANTTLHTGTTIVGHPGGILDEILYNTRGLDTVVETTILFIAFAIASYIFRKGSP
jgi:energy-converting hydrogenase A subunit F